MPRALAVLAAVLLLAACSAGGASPAPSEPEPADPAPASEPGPEPSPATLPQVVATGLQAPWGLAFLPDGTALVTERDTGEVLRVSRDTEPTPLGVVPGVAHGGEGGLLGIAVSPRFAEDGAVFVYLTAAGDNRVVRLRLDGDVLTQEAVVLDGIPKGSIHNGGRIAFGPDGFLYVATGDASNASHSQDPASLGGKILRVTPDGEPAPGNPVESSPVWSLGHRNVQGLAWTADGQLVASEFGQNMWDELNLIQPGGNYGWPTVEGVGGVPRFAEPLVTWRPEEASPSGIAVVGDVVYVAALRGEALWRVPLEGDGAGEPERLLHGEYGRLRAVEPDGTGALWLLTSNTARGLVRDGDDRVVVVDAAALS